MVAGLSPINSRNLIIDGRCSPSLQPKRLFLRASGAAPIRRRTPIANRGADLVEVPCCYVAARCSARFSCCGSDAPGGEVSLVGVFRVLFLHPMTTRHEHRAAGWRGYWWRLRHQNGVNTWPGQTAPWLRAFNLIGLRRVRPRTARPRRCRAGAPRRERGKPRPLSPGRRRQSVQDLACAPLSSHLLAGLEQRDHADPEGSLEGKPPRLGILRALDQVKDQLHRP
jgi:hypothetical protein